MQWFISSEVRKRDRFDRRELVGEAVTERDTHHHFSGLLAERLTSTCSQGKRRTVANTSEKRFLGSDLAVCLVSSTVVLSSLL